MQTSFSLIVWHKPQQGAKALHMGVCPHVRNRRCRSKPLMSAAAGQERVISFMRQPQKGSCTHKRPGLQKMLPPTKGCYQLPATFNVMEGSRLLVAHLTTALCPS